MYTIFFSEQKLIIDCHPNREPNFVSVRAYSTVDNYMTQILEFLNNPTSGKNLVLASTHPEKLFLHIKNIFNYLEAAGGLVTNQHGMMLMIYRNEKWDLPKGIIENNESPLNAAMREIEEETGIGRLQEPQPITETYHFYNSTARWCLKKTYWYRFSTSDNQDPTAQVSEGIQNARWLAAEEVKLLLPNAYASIRDVMEKAEALGK